MGDKIKILEDISTLAKMCRSKSDGASLKIEEEEINSKIADLQSEIADLKMSSEEENYDTSAEMADRNIEIISKKIIQNVKNECKVRSSELSKLKVQEEDLSNNLNNLKRTRKSYEKYISSMQDRISTSTDNEVISRYSTLISTTEEKIKKLDETILQSTAEYNEVQNKIEKLSNEIANFERTIARKQEQLNEAQKNLENKEVYIDKTKKQKTDKKIKELEDRINKHQIRLEQIHEDPKYLEIKIRDIISDNEDIFNARSYLIKLISKSAKQPYMNINADNALEEELLRATQARDSFANEIDQKTYDVMDTVNPEQIRIEYLNNRIANWNTDLKNLELQAATIDKDEQYHYEDKADTLDKLIDTMRTELKDYEKAYNDEPEANLSAKATLKVALEEKKSDLIAAQEIASKFRKDEATDIAKASHINKVEVEEIKQNINNAQKEIESIRQRLMSKKTGMKDIGSQNRDKEKLKELAKVVIDIKHRRQFSEKPIDIAERLEKELGMDVVEAAFNTNRNPQPIVETSENPQPDENRGVKVISTDEITTNRIETPEPIQTSEPTVSASIQPTSISQIEMPEPAPVQTIEPMTENLAQSITPQTITVSQTDLAKELDNFVANLDNQVTS